MHPPTSLLNGSSRDCRAYCTATFYRIKQIAEYFRVRFKTTSYRDAVHIEIHGAQGNSGDIFFFSYGAAVCWGLTKEEDLSFLKEIRDFEEERAEEMEMDEFTYIQGESAKIVEDEIILPNQETLTRLAISQGIAQSVKLGTFETAIQKTFNQSKYIPEQLAKWGKVPLSKREIRRKMGELFIERSSINLHIDVLSPPEFFWEYPELEPYYLLTANYLDIKSRAEALNQRLDVVHELFQMLGSELNHQHSSRLEWTIIWLIIIEVILTLLKDVFGLL